MIFLQSPEKSPQFANNLSSMYPNGNTQPQIRKWWVPLISAIYLFSFWSEFWKDLSTFSTRCSKEKTLKDSIHFFKKIMLHPSTAKISNVKLKGVSKVCHVLYHDSTGEYTMSKCQTTDEFTIKVRALLYYVHTTTYNRINCKFLRFLIWCHTRRRFRASLSFRVSDSGHCVTSARNFCTNNPGHKLYRSMSVRSTRHHTLLHNPKILHTKTFFVPACHLRKIYRCMTARSTRHHTLLNNPTILHEKIFFAPACHQHQKILSTSKYDFKKIEL